MAIFLQKLFTRELPSISQGWAKAQNPQKAEAIRTLRALDSGGVDGHCGTQDSLQHHHSSRRAVSGSHEPHTPCVPSLHRKEPGLRSQVLVHPPVTCQFRNSQQVPSPALHPWHRTASSPGIPRLASSKTPKVMLLPTMLATTPCPRACVSTKQAPLCSSQVHHDPHPEKELASEQTRLQGAYRP